MRERKTGNIFGHNSISAQGEVLVALVELDRNVSESIWKSQLIKSTMHVREL